MDVHAWKKLDALPADASPTSVTASAAPLHSATTAAIATGGEARSHHGYAKRPSPASTGTFPAQSSKASAAAAITAYGSMHAVAIDGMEVADGDDDVAVDADDCHDGDDDDAQSETSQLSDL